MNPRRVLLCGLNWIGDNVMAMPAVQAYRRAHPDDAITVLVKRALVPLWQMHAAPSRVLAYDDTHTGTFAAGAAMRRDKFDACYVLPHSFRSAWVPFLAGIPERAGLAGGFRDVLLTHVVQPKSGPHQQYEYIDLLVPDDSGPPESPRLQPPPLSTYQPGPKPRIGLIPGAARGPSKRWPAEHFADVGKRLAETKGASLLVFGAPSESELCASVAKSIGNRAQNFAGRTSLPEWAALLQACDLVVCNDSGGMHLASALGTPVVAIYGMTDPAKTGPLGRNASVIQDEGARARDIAQDSEEAEKRLAAIAPGRVYDAAVDALAAGR